MTEQIELFVQAILPKCHACLDSEKWFASDTNNLYCCGSQYLKDKTVYIYNAPFISGHRAITFADLPVPVPDGGKHSIRMFKINNDCQYISVFIDPDVVVLYKNGIVADVCKIPPLVRFSHGIMNRKDAIVIGYAVEKGKITEYFIKNDVIVHREYVNDLIRSSEKSYMIHRTDGFMYYIDMESDILVVDTLCERNVMEKAMDNDILNSSTNIGISYASGIAVYITNYRDTHIISNMCLKTGKIKRFTCDCTNEGNGHHTTCRVGDYTIYETKDAVQRYIMYEKDKIYDVVGATGGHYLAYLGAMLHETDDNLIIRSFKWNWNLFTMQPRKAQRHAILVFWALRDRKLPRDLLRLIAEMCLMPF